MASILVLTLKDLRRRLADPTSLLLHLAIPLAIAGAMAITFGHRPGTEAAAPRLRMVVVNLDKSPISDLLVGATQNPEAARRMEIKQAPDKEEGLRLLRDEEYAALVLIPAGFGDAVLDGRPTSFELVKNPAQRLMPVAAQQVVEVAALYVSGGARLLGEDGPRLHGLLENEGWQDTAALTALVTRLRDRLTGVGQTLLPPIIEVKQDVDPAVEEGKSGGGFDFLAWMYPGMVVMGLIFTGLAQMKDLLRERDAGTLRRQLAAPVSATQLLIAKVLSVSVVVALALAVLMAIGSLALGVHWGAPLPLAASSVVLVAAVTGFAALLFSMVSTERQGDAFGGILTMVMSLLGGAFVPVEAFPDWMAHLARFTVNYWGNGTLRELAAGGGWEQIGPYLRVLSLLGGAMTLLGVAMLRRRHVRGAL